MKQSVCTLIVACLLATTAVAHSGVDVRDVRLLRSGETVQLVMDVDFGQGKSESDGLLILTPRLVGATDSIDFPAMVVLGRWTYYADLRRGEHSALPSDAHFVRYTGKALTEHYARTVTHQPWMDQSVLRLIRSEGDPCSARVTAVSSMQGFVLPPPDTTYVVKKKTRDEELTGKVSGQARIRFRVNRTEILPELSANSRELSRIREAIDEVKRNPDVRITKYTLQDNIITIREPAHPWLALKTNLLIDALLTPNVELEAQLGRDSRWSIMIEDWFPWFLYRKNS